MRKNKNILQERLNLNGEVLTDRFVITSNYYHENWTKKDIGQDIISFCDKIDHALENLKFKVA